MRRIRFVFGLLALATLGALSALVAAALGGIARDRDERHRILAERAFEEMQRELDRVLSREEARPFSHFDFYFVPEAVSPGRYVVARSPLSLPPAEEWLIGYFQIDPNGELHSPLIPRERDFARAIDHWDFTEAIARSSNAVERALGRRLRPGSGQPAPTRGTARAESGSRLLRRPGESTASEGAGPLARLDPYRLLGSFARRRTDAPEPPLPARASEPPTLRLLSQSAAVGPGGVAIGIPVIEVLEATGALYAHRDARVESVYDVQAAIGEAPMRVLPAAVFPMTAKVLGRRQFVLHREAYLGNAAYRQGLLIDFSRFSKWIDARIFGRSDLAEHASREYYLREAPPTATGVSPSYVFEHRFEAPFDEIVARLSLPPLPDMAAAPAVYAIAGLLVLAAAGGLFALYRTVTLTVSYAERRSNFAAAVSHELKTPLTAIRMHAEMLREGMVPSEQKRREYLDTIGAESERLTRLIQNVLEFSSLEQGRRSLALDRACIASALGEIGQRLEPELRAAGFAFELAIEPDLPEVAFERDALTQIVFNLIDNAIKYGRGSEVPRISLCCRRAGDAVEIAVQDGGPGVPERELRAIFEPFHRVENELTRRAKGTGIGLALVKGLASRMGAVVRARNLPQGGFEVALGFRIPS
jgi:signal transduction histidine kinase